MERHIFHLSIPVSDLETSKRFYVGVLGAAVGRENADWLDVLLWGHQITLQRRPDDVRTLEEQGKRHFGATLPWSVWEAYVGMLRSKNVTFLGEPKIMAEGTPDEHGKFYLVDPSNNVIEVKAYRDTSRTLHLPVAAGASPNLATVERYMEGFRKTDREGILSCVTDDVEWVVPGAFRAKGKAEFATHIVDPGFSGQPVITVDRYLESGEVVVAEGSVRAPRIDGSVLDLAMCDVFDMKDEKVRRLTSYLMPRG
jgi:extradiol dioxygenase family protein/ketosteroid isomerase-like protein